MSWPAGWTLHVDIPVDPKDAKQARMSTKRAASAEEIRNGAPGLHRVRTKDGRSFHMVPLDSPQKYIQKETRKLRMAIQDAVGQAKRLQDLSGVWDGPVSLSWVAVFELPKSKERVRSPPGRTWRTSRPDRDNIEKPIMDALQGLVYTEDRQVVTGTTHKVQGAQGEPPRLILTIQDATHLPVPLQIGAPGQVSLFRPPTPAFPDNKPLMEEHICQAARELGFDPAKLTARELADSINKALRR